MFSLSLKTLYHFFIDKGKVDVKVTTEHGHSRWATPVAELNLAT
jgi:hypothetical protein